MFSIEKIKNSYGLTNINMNGEKGFNKNTFIYAPNGTFKTSFSKFIESIFNDKDAIKDRYVEGKKAEYDITIFGNQIKETTKEDLNDISFYNFSLEKYENLFLDSQFYSRLAYNSEVIKLIDDKFQIIKKEMQKIIDILTYFNISFANFDYSKISMALNLKDKIKIIEKLNLDYIFELFKESTKYKFSKEPSSITNLRNETEIKKLKNDYAVISNSTNKKFINGIFTLDKAEAFIKSISKSNEFFEVGHGIVLKNEKTIYDYETLNNLFQDELKEILKSGNNKEAYEKIKKSLYSANNTKIFADKFDEDASFINYLSINDDKVKQIIEWLFDHNLNIDYLKNVNYKLIEETLQDIISIVENNETEKTTLENIFDEFNQKFINYINVKLINKTDSILNRELPMIEFKLNNYTLDKEKINYISSGEKRALAFIHFYMDIKLSKNDKKLIIIDDGAESFDYAYKYSFIEYILELCSHEQNQIIVLSHNFDFIRTLSVRFEEGACETRIARKTDSTITIRKEKLKKLLGQTTSSPFNNLAQISIIRELANITGKTEVETYFTKLLHIKSEEIYNVTLNDIYNMGKDLNINIESFRDNNDKYFDYIIKTVKEDISDSLDNNLSKKIVYSIAIRLMFEKYSIDKLFANDYNKLTNITKDQTRTLFNLLNDDDKKVFAPVLIKTPEFIHINSLSYEPLYDISLGQLIQLKNEIVKYIETSKIH